MLYKILLNIRDLTTHILIFLTGMSDRVVDESNPDNYLSTKDVHSLWAEEDLLKEIPIEPWDIQGCVQKCNKLGDVVRILIKFLFLL